MPALTLTLTLILSTGVAYRPPASPLGSCRLRQSRASSWRPPTPAAPLRMRVAYASVCVRAYAYAYVVYVSVHATVQSQRLHMCVAPTPEAPCAYMLYTIICPHACSAMCIYVIYYLRAYVRVFVAVYLTAYMPPRLQRHVRRRHGCLLPLCGPDAVRVRVRVSCSGSGSG